MLLWAVGVSLDDASGMDSLGNPLMRYLKDSWSSGCSGCAKGQEDKGPNRVSRNV